MKKICTVDGCERNAKTKGLCSKHYLRSITKFSQGRNTKRITGIKICIIPGCESSHESKGFCNKHYRRYLRHGDPIFTTMEMHGMYLSSEYTIWHGIKNRCKNKKDTNYKRYGGRGITICERWGNSFSAFLQDMGKRPFSNAQIDRIDNNGNYEPSNCRWVTPSENCLNRSTSKKNKTI